MPAACTNKSVYVTVHAKTNDKSVKKFFRFRKYSISNTYIVILESITLTTPEIRLRERERTGIRIEILENAMFGLIQLSVYAFVRSIEERLFSRVEMDHRQKERSIEVSNEQYLL